MTRPRWSDPAPRGRPLPLARLFAAALVLILCACKGEARPLGGAPVEPDATPIAGTTAKSDSQQAPAGTSAAAPAPPNAPPAPAPDTCAFRRELAAWSDSALSVQRYGDYLVLQFALMEVETPVQPAAGAPAARVDSAAAIRVCTAARGRDLNAFLPVYRAFAPASTLSPGLVGKLGQLGPRIAAFASDSANLANDSTAAPADAIVPGVEVPWVWLAALLAVVAIAAAVLWYALRGISLDLQDAGKQMRDSDIKQGDQLGAVKFSCDQILRSSQSLRQDLETAQRQTLAETKNEFGWLRGEMAMLRDSLANRTDGSSGTGASSGESRTRGGGELRVSHDPFGHDQWEETVVDVRPADGGSASIHADQMGVFIVRFAPGSTAEARLSVDPSRAIGAGLRDRLDAAFRCRGVPRGTDRYHTVQDASCTWDPATGQGRITHLGEVEEAG